MSYIPGANGPYYYNNLLPMYSGTLSADKRAVVGAGPRGTGFPTVGTHGVSVFL